MRGKEESIDKRKKTEEKRGEERKKGREKSSNEGKKEDIDQDIVISL